MFGWPRTRAAEVLRFWPDYVETAPDEFGSAPALLTAPPAPFIPEHLQGQAAFGIIFCCLGDPEDGEAMVKPLRGLAPDLDMVGPMPYAAVQMLTDEATPHGLHNYWKAENLPELSDEAIDTVIDVAAGVTSPLSMVLLEPKGRAISRVGEGDSALGGRDAAHTLYCFSMWTDPAESDPRRLDPFADGADGPVHHTRRVAQLHQRPAGIEGPGVRTSPSRRTPQG